MTLRSWFRAIVLLSLLLAVSPVDALAVDPPPPGTSIPIPDLVTQAEVASDDLSSIDQTLGGDDAASTVEGQLPALTETIDADYVETQRLLQSQPSLETLRESTTRWDATGSQLAGWQRELTARAAALQGIRDRLDGMQRTWTTSLEVSRGSNLPPEVVLRVETVVTAIGLMLERVETRRSQVIALQQRVGDQRSRVNEVLSSIKQTRDLAVGRIWTRDSAPLWSSRAFAVRPGALVAETRNSFATQFGALGAYLAKHVGILVVHALAAIALACALFVARRRVRAWVVEDPSLANTGHVFRLPAAMALVMALLASGPFYLQAPRLLFAVIGVVALLVTVVILHPIVARSMCPVLYALVAFYVVDRVGSVVQSLPVESRLLGLVEALAGVVFLAWYLATRHGEESDRVHRLARVGAFATIALFAFAFVANVVGFAALQRLVTSSVIGAAYSAVVLYAAVLIAEGLVVYALRSRPLALLGAIRRHRLLVRRRIWKAIRWIAVVVWVAVRLDQLAILDVVTTNVSAALGAELRVGSIAISAGDVLLFGLTLWAATLLSRLVRFVLEEDVFTRVELDRGVPYAVTTVVHYTVIVVGFLFALGAIGVDMTRFTILTGAFGVGLGLGLQGVVSNFVSGLVLLFERPVNVGDAVQIGQHTGYLRRIGLRSSIVRTGLGSEVIVPNGHLITNEVVNWTLTDRQRLIEIGVGVAYGTDPRRVMALLTGVAAAHRDVIAEPPPTTLFVGFGESALDFQLRAWTAEFDTWRQVQSDLSVGVSDALAAAGIEIPFPQREVSVRGVSPAVLDALGAGDDGPAPLSADDAPDAR